MAKRARTMIEALKQCASSRETGYTHMAEDGTTRFESFQELYRRASRIGLPRNREAARDF